jgi:hypothetical protein
MDNAENILSCRVHAVPGSGDGHHGMLGIEVIMHELRGARGQVVAIPSIFDCRGVEAVSAFERSLGRSRLPGTIWAITAPSFKAYRVGRHRGVRELTVIRGQVVEAGQSC